MMNEGTHVFIEKILALPFLPARQIEPIFCSLTKDHDSQWKETIPQLLELIKYVNGTWILHSTWNPEAWSVYGHQNKQRRRGIPQQTKLKRKTRDAALPAIHLPSQRVNNGSTDMPLGM